MKKKVAVVIPVYREKMTLFEKISLKQVLKVLKKRQVYLIAPYGLNLKNYPKQRLKIVRYPAEYLSSVNAYSRLLRSKKFYSPFKSYEFILIAQLDTFVFSDKLDEWMSKPYDYVGAPWIFTAGVQVPEFVRKDLPFLHRHKFLSPLRFFSNDRFLVGNGGLSLRRTAVFLRALDDHQKDVEKYEEETKMLVASGCRTADNEDAFWSIYLPARGCSLRIPGYREALNFAFETRPKKCFKLNKCRLPFGCHGWDKNHFDFWKKHIRQAGYEL